ncbi:MAG: hypothetical protein JWM36_492 [Hyphomicrobiales bacterium]|jgi:hypothetical protein|nr:hypothetical protein [Hyphomicrobiales bacterium]
MSAAPLNLDLATWTEPLVGDIVTSAYARLISDERAINVLSRFHILLWRNAIAEHEQAEASRRELHRIAKRFDVTDTEVREIDMQVIAELMHVISRRFRRSPETTRDCSMEMLRVACWLTEGRDAAA